MEDVSVKLQIDGANITTHPVFGDDIKLKITTETDQIFHRQSIGGTFKFLGEDFDIIEKCSDNITFTLSVYKGVSLVGSATFVKADCEFNYDDKVCSVKLTTTDRYETLLGNLDNKYNLVKLAPEIKSLHLTLRPIIQLYARGDNKITNIYGGMYFEQDCTMVTENTELINTYHFADASPLAYIQIDTAINGAPADIIGRYYMKDSMSAANILYYHETADYHIQVSIGMTLNFMLYDNNDTFIAVADLSSWDDAGDYSLIFTKYDGGSTIQKATGSYIKDGEIYSRLLCPVADGSGFLYDRPTSDITEKDSNYPYVAQLSGDIFVPRLTMIGEKTITATEWGVDDNGNYFQKPILTSTQQADGINIMPVARSFWNRMSTWLFIDNTINHIYDACIYQYTLKDAYPLWSAIKVLLNKVDPTIHWDKTAFYSEALFIPKNNSNTGLSGSIGLPNARFSGLYITPITNVKKTKYDRPAQRGDMTLKQIFDMLRNVYNLYWWIDDNNNLRIEHIAYFKQGKTYAAGEPNPDLDITTMMDYPNGENWFFGTNDITHDRSQCVSRTEFEWGDSCTYPFIGEPVDIKDKYADLTKKDKLSITNFIADMDYVIIAPDSVSDDLYALIEADYNMTVATPKIRFSPTSPIYEVQNGYCSFLYLENNVLSYDRGGWNAKAGNTFLVTRDIKKFVKQTVNFPITLSQIEGLDLIKTGIGEGFLDEMEVNMNTLFAKAKLSISRYNDSSSALFINTYMIGERAAYYIYNYTADPLIVTYATVRISDNTIIGKNETSLSPFETINTGIYADEAQLKILSAVPGGFYKLKTRSAFAGGKMSFSDYSWEVGEYHHISIDGNNYSGSVDWGYLQVKADVDIQITITASSATNHYGWISNVPCIRDEDFDTLPSSQQVSGTGTITYDMAAGTKMYIGYTKDLTPCRNDDKIMILIVES